MIPRRIRGASHYLGAPAGWQPDKDGDCGHLAIRTHGDPRGGRGWCESAWEPTPTELEVIKAGGSIILRVIGWQPPVALYVEHVDGAGMAAVEAAAIQPERATVCPKCETAITPLSLFCAHHGCPVVAAGKRS